MNSWNLERRMLAAALVWLVLAWGLGGTVLALVFRAAVIDRFDSKLEALVDGLVDQVSLDAHSGLTIASAHPSFSVVEAGWYWIIDDGTRRTASTAEAFFADFPIYWPGGPYDLAISEGTGPDGRPLRVAARLVSDPGTRGVEGSHVLLAVALDRREINEEIRSFTSLMIAAAFTLGIVLLIGVVVQTHVALSPLRRLRGELSEVEAGVLEQLSGTYPPDIRSVAEAMNGVLERDRAVTAWARKSAGNLAHALKTELALLRQLGREGSNDASMAAATDRIAGIVDHHLNRATLGATSGIRTRADTRQVVTAVASSLERIFAHRAIAIHVDISRAPDFRGEVQDLEEMVGNLLENACRHATTQVRAMAFDADGKLHLVVEDDGPGLPPERRDIATRRGERLDEKGPGAGLGLAIVSDLAELYGGRFTLAQAPLGGLEARIELPAAA